MDTSLPTQLLALRALRQSRWVNSLDEILGRCFYSTKNVGNFGQNSNGKVMNWSVALLQFSAFSLHAWHWEKRYKMERTIPLGEHSLIWEGYSNLHSWYFLARLVDLRKWKAFRVLLKPRKEITPYLCLRSQISRISEHVIQWNLNKSKRLSVKYKWKFSHSALILQIFVMLLSSL